MAFAQQAGDRKLDRLRLTDDDALNVGDQLFGEEGDQTRAGNLIMGVPACRDRSVF